MLQRSTEQSRPQTSECQYGVNSSANADAGKSEGVNAGSFTELNGGASYSEAYEIFEKFSDSLLIGGVAEAPTIAIH
jgi:hypothetical protein